MGLLVGGAVTHASLLVNGEHAEQAADAFNLRFGSMPFSPAASSIISSRTVIFDQKAAVARIDVRQGPPTIGLHFNVTEGPPLSQQMKDCIDLVHWDEGLQSHRFKGKASNLIVIDNLAPVAGNRSTTCSITHAIKCELDAQLASFYRLRGAPPPERAPLQPCWVDGHHHIHVTPVVHSLLLGHPLVGGVRCPRDAHIILPPSNHIANVTGDYETEDTLRRFQSDSDCFGPPFWFQVASRAALNRVAFSSQTASAKRTTDFFVGLDMMGSACSKAALFKRLENIERSCRSYDDEQPACAPVTVEVMTHVGLAVPSEGVGGVGVACCDPFYHDEFSRSFERKLELDVYASTCVAESA